MLHNYTRCIVMLCYVTLRYVMLCYNKKMYCYVNNRSKEIKQDHQIIYTSLVDSFGVPQQAMVQKVKGYELSGNSLALCRCAILKDVEA